RRRRSHRFLGRRPRRPPPATGTDAGGGLRNRLSGELTSTQKYPVEHLWSEPTREGVLLRRVVAAQHGRTGTETHLGSVPEARLGPGHLPAETRCVLQDPGERQTPEGHDHPNGRVGQIGEEPAGAVGNFLRSRPVLWRGAADAGRDAETGQFETVSDVGGGRLVGESDPMQGGEEEVTGTVTGEHATGAVGPVRRGRQTDDEDRRFGVAQRGDRSPPVLLITERRTLLDGHPLPPLDEPGTETALDQIHD